MASVVRERGERGEKRDERRKTRDERREKIEERREMRDERRETRDARRETREVAREGTEVAREKMSGATRDDMKDERVEMRRGDEERDARLLSRRLEPPSSESSRMS